MGLTLNDLTPETRAKLGLRRPRKVEFDKDAVRRHAIRCLATIAELSQSERRRVLTHALRVNDQ